MKKKKQALDDEEVRVIKIGADALFEFIYENIIEAQDIYLDVDPLSVTDSFHIDWENRQFIFCAYKSEKENGEILDLPESVDFDKLIKKIPETTDSMYKQNRYKTYKKSELEDFCK